MAYIGKQPTVGNFVKLDAITTSATDTFNLTNGTVAYYPQSANHCIVSLNGVIQSPTTSFTISGSTIVFASALTATDVIDFILVLGDVLNIGTPSDATVGFSKVTSNLITGATAETSIDGADSVLIYDDSATALRKMTRTNFIGGGNTPNFQAYLSSAQTLSSGVETKIQFNTEDFDSDNIYDNATNYRFTVPSGKGGKYFVYSILLPFCGNNNSVFHNLIVKKNNSSIITLDYNLTGNAILRRTHLTYTSILNLSVNDYIEIFGQLDGTGTINIGANSLFGAYKIIE